MQCHTCGTLLLDGTARCPACGSTMQADESKSPYELDDEAIPFIDYAGRRPASTAAPAAKPAPSPTGASPSPALAGASLPPRINIAPQPSMENRTSARRRMSAGVAALLVVLAFVLIEGGGFGYYLAKVQPAELNAQATGVVQHILTAQVQASAEAKSQALAAFTAKSPQDIYTQVTSRTPDFSDPLSKEDSNWINGEAGGEACIFSGGTYHAVETNSPRYDLCLAPFTNYSNFAYQVRMTLLSGDGGGLLFRLDYKHYTFYRFNVSQDGSYALYVRNHNAPETILADGFSPTISTAMYHSAMPSIIATVVAYAKYIYLYVNGQFLALAKDNTIDSGVIGLTSASVAHTTEIAFSSVEVWIL